MDQDIFLPAPHAVGTLPPRIPCRCQAFPSDSQRTGTPALSNITNWGNTVGTNTLAETGTGTVQSLTVYGQVPAGE